MKRFAGAGSNMNLVPNIQIERVIGIPFNFSFTGGAGVAYTTSYTISTAYEFLWDITGLYQSTARDFQMNIRDEHTSEDMFTSNVWASMITGNGQNQNALMHPYIFRPGTTVTVTAVDTTGGGAITTQVLLMGYKAHRATA